MAEKFSSYPELLRRPDPDMTPRPTSASADLDLHEACRKGKTPVVIDLLTRGADIEKKTSRDETPLLLAAQFSHPDLVRELFDLGADIRVTDTRGMSPLAHVCHHGYVDLFKYLQEKIKDRYHGYLKENHRKLFSAACSGGCIQMIEYLLSEAHVHDDIEHSLLTLLQNGGDDVMRCMVKLHGVLHSACQTGSLEVVQFLIAQGAEVSGITEFGETPLHSACAGGQAEVVRHLVSEPGVDVKVKDFRGLTPMHMACLSGSLGSITCLLEHGADVTESCDEGLTGLDLVCNEGHEKVVEYLLEHDLVKDINSALYAACEGGHVTVIDLLIKHGADVESRHQFGESVLFGACQNQHKHVIEHLYKMGADLNAATGDKVSLLCASAEVGNLDIINFLLEHGAIIDHVTEEGKTAIHAAHDYEHHQVAALLWKRWLRHRIRQKLDEEENLTTEEIEIDDLDIETTLEKFLEEEVGVHFTLHVSNEGCEKVKDSEVKEEVEKDGCIVKAFSISAAKSCPGDSESFVNFGKFNVRLMKDVGQTEVDQLTKAMEDMSLVFP